MINNESLQREPLPDWVTHLNSFKRAEQLTTYVKKFDYCNRQKSPDDQVSFSVLVNIGLFNITGSLIRSQSTAKVKIAAIGVAI